MDYDESATKEFVNRLPEPALPVPSCHLLMLALRSRKMKEQYGFKIKDILVERRIIRPMDARESSRPDWRRRFLDTVYNFTVLKENGRYTYNGVVVPSSVMGIMSTVTPRDMYRGLLKYTKDNLDYVWSLHARPTDEALAELTKHNTRLFGFLHQTRVRGFHASTVDIDVHDRPVLDDALSQVSALPVWMVTETGRGYHIILDLSRKEDAVLFFSPQGIGPTIAQKYKGKVHIMNDSQEPVPGTAYSSPDDPHHLVRIIQ